MPTPLIEISMSLEEFRVMPHRLGWKHEYWDGMARLSPNHSAIASFEWVLNGLCAPAPVLDDAYSLRPVSQLDESALVRLNRESFDQSVEFAGYSDSNYEKKQLEFVASFFNPDPSNQHSIACPHHSFAVASKSELVAAILIREMDSALVIQPVMVHPLHLRQGLATALLAETLRSLYRRGRQSLTSQCYLANAASMAWHQAAGFVETPEYSVASARANHHRWMAGHYKSLGRNTEAEMQIQEASHWSALYKQWFAIEMKRFSESVDNTSVAKKG